MARGFENNRDVALQTINVRNALAFMLDYFQNIKEEELSIIHVANRAIDSLHGIDKCLDEIEAVSRCRVG
jgi:hypothetical protein